MKKLLFIMTFATILAACCGENSEKSGPQPLVIDYGYGNRRAEVLDRQHLE